MLVSKILAEVKEAVGKCSDDFALQTLTRAVELLANKGLVDPLVGYFDFSVSDGYFVALPRDVKTVLRININNQPTFSRSRLYEFNINSDGTANGAEPGLSWGDRGYSPIQDEKKLPGTLAYKVSQSGDNGKTCTVTGLDGDGRQHTVTLTGHATTPTASTVTFHKVTRVVRQPTAAEAFLWCNGNNVCAQYYADEEVPEYRVIKLSKTATNVRVMFRRHVFEVTTVDDFIPMNSALAVIHACKAVRYLATDESDRAMAALAMAEMFHREEQASRDEHNTLAETEQVLPAIDSAIFMRDGVVVGDVYDAAASIFGPVGRRKLFDKITTAIELLSNKGQWDPRLGVVDVFTADNTEEVTYRTPTNGTTGRGYGYYVLPRHVETPVAFNYGCAQTMPRNRWFEFHLNGNGGRDFASCGRWDDAGDVCLIRRLPLDVTQEPKDRHVVPTYLVAVPDSANDNGTAVRIYGFERDDNGRDVEVWRAGERGWLCPCEYNNFNPGTGAPRWTAVERITKAESQGFIRLYATTYEQTEAAIPAIPSVPATDVTTVSDSRLAVAAATWQEPAPQDLVGYLVVNQDGSTQTATLYADGAHTLPIGNWSQEAVLDTIAFSVSPMGNPWGTLTGYDLSVSGFAALPNLTNEEFVITRNFTPMVPEVPAVPAVFSWVTGALYGMWYPDELEPRYRAIKLSHANPRRIRLLFRKRTTKVASLTEPIPLKSRLAIETAMRAIKALESGDTANANVLEAMAVKYLREERINLGPTAVGMLQFDPGTSPGFAGNIQ